MSAEHPIRWPRRRRESARKLPASRRSQIQKRPGMSVFRRWCVEGGAEVGAWLRKVIQGYYQCRAVPGNTAQFRGFRRRGCRLWRNVLIFRRQRAQVGWDRLNPLLDQWIPQPRVLHPYPDQRFDAIRRQ